jgi:hypothetical protein
MNPQQFGLWGAYIRAEYWIGFPEDRLLLRIGERAEGILRVAPDATLHFGPQSSWAYITAWNPGSEIQMEFVNRKKQEELEMHLRGSGYAVLPGYSRDPEGEWPDEEGIFVYGLTWENALLLGRKYSQNAILAGLGEETVQLLRC